MSIVLVEPDASGHLSGGFRYNAEVAKHPDVTLERLTSGNERAQIDALQVAPGAVVIADSLYLSGEWLDPLLSLRQRSGCRLGVLLHAFPSFIERASQPRGQFEPSQALRPSEHEMSLVRQLDVLVAPGPYVQRLLAGSGVRVVVCPPGRDVAAPASSDPPRPESSGRPLQRLISLGAVTRLKGLSDAVDALAGLGESSFEWHLVGSLEREPDHVDELRRRVRSLGLDARVRLLGQRPHAEALRRLQQSDWLLLPSYTENHPLVAREALAAGVPVIGYDAGGVADVVRHDESGLLAPTGDRHRLGVLLRRALDEPTLRPRLSRAAREAAREWPSWDEARAGFVRALRSIP